MPRLYTPCMKRRLNGDEISFILKFSGRRTVPLRVWYWIEAVTGTADGLDQGWPVGRIESILSSPRQVWRETGDRTSTRLRALLPGGRSRGARKRPRPLDSADHSRSPRRSHRGRESARRGHPHVFHPSLAAEKEQGTLGCFQSSCNSPESIFASLARGSLSYSAVTPTLG
jgi:hypothetical protein